MTRRSDADDGEFSARVVRNSPLAVEIPSDGRESALVAVTRGC
jgi:hypothetical protein